MTTTTASKDGRQQRSMRSRQSIIDAMIALMKEGELMPTAQSISDTAGVSIRSVFRHFSELDLLYAEVDKALRPIYSKHFKMQMAEGPLTSRLASAVKCRVDTYAESGYVTRASRVLMTRSSFVQGNFEKMEQSLHKELLRIVPEVAALSDDDLALITSFLSFDYIERLHSCQKLPLARCEALIFNLCAGLLNAS